MTRKSEDPLDLWDREHVWHAFSQMSEYQGLIIRSAQGCWLEGIDGQRLLDGASSLWCNVHGHRHPTIDAAIRKQLDEVAHVTSLGMSHPTTIYLSKALVDLAPPGLNHVFFSSDGSSAIEVALKLAFQFWRQCDTPSDRRTTYLTIGNAYHGDTLGSVSIGGVQRFHAMFHPLLFPVVRGPCPDLYRRPESVSTEQACDHYLRVYRELFEREGDRLAALVIEPIIQGAAGMVLHPTGFLAGLRQLCNEYNVLMIADEVAVGMGRTGKMMACDHELVVPDLLCLGKGLSGGYLPIAATIASTRIWNAFLGNYEDSKSFFHGHTYGGNPLACAASLATLELFRTEKTLERLPEKAAILQSCLAPLRDHPHVGDVRQKGMMAAIELVEEKRLKTPYPWAEKRGIRACQRAIEKGVWLRPIGNVIPVLPPLSISIDEIHFLCEAVMAGVDAATR